MDLLAKLLEIIENGNAPSLGELSPQNNLVDDYYDRLVRIILEEKEANTDFISQKIDDYVLNYGMKS